MAIGLIAVVFSTPGIVAGTNWGEAGKPTPPAATTSSALGQRMSPANAGGRVSAFSGVELGNDAACDVLQSTGMMERISVYFCWICNAISSAEWN